MALEIIIVIIVAIPIAVLVMFSRKAGARSVRQILVAIAGRILLVVGLIALFPSFYLLFNEGDRRLAAVCLAASLLFVICGFVVIRREERVGK
ncbi:MAG: hypothetical protein PHY31_04535 [Smithellaceae bacterium]|nr:hypothetical protein [Smithellaceae bacterium]